MQLIVLDPAAPPRAMPPEAMRPDPSDSVSLAWLDLDRSETPELLRLVAPGMLVTVHSGERSAVEDLRDPARWRRHHAPPLSRAALEILVCAMLDGYDDLIDETEGEIGRLHDRSVALDRRAVAAQLLQHRRRMMAVKGKLSGQRERFADVARSGSRTPPDGSRWIHDRLEAAIAGAREAADYSRGPCAFLWDRARGAGIWAWCPG